MIPRGAATGYVQAASGLTFHDLQRQAEDVAPYGVGWYMKSGHARDLSPDLSRRLVDHAVGYRAVACPGVQREVYAIQPLGSAASDVAEGEAAYAEDRHGGTSRSRWGSRLRPSEPALWTGPGSPGPGLSRCWT